jgi:hypothetical protein
MRERAHGHSDPLEGALVGVHPQWGVAFSSQSDAQTQGTSMNLIGITFHGNRPHDFPNAGFFNFRRPDHGLVGWRVQVRGVRVFFVSPKGWTAGIEKGRWPKDGPSTIFEVSRSSLSLHWEGDGETLDVDKATWPAEERAVKKA